ncbi:MAG: hypothetical protein EBT13_07940, partial [Rhodobacteraceae bacterium]|nr:hypothetical protein [Paracoccaceae bacterium]
MANESGFLIGSQWCFRDPTDFSPTAANDMRIGTPTYVSMVLDGTIADGSAWQSAKTGSLATSSRLPAAFRVDACLEFNATPTDGKIVEFFWSGSNSSTAGTDNMGGASGANGSFTISNGEENQLIRIGALVVNDRTGSAPYLCKGKVGIFVPQHEYGSLIIVNRSGATLYSTDAAEHHITLTAL